jgi:peptidyl-prolyl cis-trans isomerase SurA|tara:strand:+ start:5587 stop:6519 length:933 start_codon:yes stop_codon:yes gene_type:complete
MIRSKLIILLIFLISFNIKANSVENIKILYKVNNKILTNVDVNNEAKYLSALSSKLKNLSIDKILIIAEESLLRETIKKNELEKYFTLDQKNPYLNEVIKDLYLRLGIASLSEFKEYLKTYDLTIPEIKKKLEIESTWNDFIYDKFKNQIVIDKDKIEKIIKNKINNETNKSFLLSEIVFQRKNTQKIEDKKALIKISIKEIGFENAANLHSIADSRKFGGNIGWIDEKSLSKKILNKINNLNIGQYSETIQSGNNYLILKVDNIKIEKTKVNKDDEMNKMITFETNKQLNRFSSIFFNKIKINTVINDL